ncbi:MAG: crosslink repair DNA glycosylase YcaQ family protein [Vicinamibacterales bacterium]
MPPPLTLSRSQILAFRRRAGALDERLPAGATSLRRAAWAGLQDSMPRAALLSIHARVAGATPSTWEHRSLVQMWGPRFSDYVVAARDLAVFSLGRLPDHPRRRARAFDTAAGLHAVLAGRRLPFGAAGHALGVPHNSLRYAAPTGTVLMRWDGARQPEVWTVPAPVMEPGRARLELARRYLHVFAPATPASLAKWAGIGDGEARAAFAALAGELTAVRTPIGDAWILTADEPALRARPGPPAAARFLPSGDAFFLLWGADRELLVPDRTRRAQLWTTRVWPGALLVHGEIAGVWRRAGTDVSIDLWRRLSPPEWAAVEAEAAALPLRGAVTVRCGDPGGTTGPGRPASRHSR